MKYIFLFLLCISFNSYSSKEYVVDLEFSGTSIPPMTYVSSKKVACENARIYYNAVYQSFGYPQEPKEGFYVGESRLYTSNKTLTDESNAYYCGLIKYNPWGRLDSVPKNWDYYLFASRPIAAKCLSNQKSVLIPHIGTKCQCINPDHLLTSTGQCVPKDCTNSAIPAINCLKEDVVNALTEFSQVFTTPFDKYDQSIQSAITQLDKENPTSAPHDNEDEDTENQNVDLDQLNADIPVLNQKIDHQSFLYNLFPTSVSCPSDNTVTLMGNTYTFTYSKLCNALILMSNIFMILAIYSSFKIIRSV
jgi:hypothetical protein